MDVCLLVCVIVTYRRPNCWTKWAEIWHGGGDGLWDGLWMGVIHHFPCGGRGRKHKNGCVYLLPIGAQTIGPNGMKFGMGVGMDSRMVYGWV